MTVIIDSYDPRRIWFTADNHFGHTNIIKYTNRPYSSVNYMNMDMVAKWNLVVEAGDFVFHAGDFSLNDSIMPYIVQLNGRIHMLTIPWHHDKRWLARERVILENSNLIKFLPPIEVLQFPNIFEDKRFKITFSHYPMAEWEAGHYGTWQFHGHSHGNYVDPKFRAVVDIGVDSQGFAPVNLLDLATKLAKDGFYQKLKGFNLPVVYH